MAEGACLLADIGGTNARFGLLKPGAEAASAVARLPVSGYATCEAALADYLGAQGGEAQVAAAAIAIAGPVEAEEAALTNAAWHFSRARLSEALGGARVKLLNDFEALAWSLPALTAEDLFSPPDWPREGRPGAPIALLGPGTGLGVAGYVPLEDDGARILVTEGGHVTLPATNAREAALLEVLRGRFDHVSAERLLSGSGLENLAWASAELDGRPQQSWNAVAITEAALEGDPAARALVEQFCAWLGVVASNLALSLGARGGVFIGGGILPRLRGQWADSAFRTRFEAKGRFAGYMKAIPTRLILASDPAFLGLARAARRLLGPT